MKAALIVPRITSDRHANLATIFRMAEDAASSGVDFILLPEAVLTGLVNTDEPSHDLPLGEAIPGSTTDQLGEFCLRYGVWFGFGMFEREEARLYDSAVLLGPDGSIALKYRRNQPQWHSRDADADVYHQGSDIGIAHTPMGNIGFLICGDLFDDGILSRFADLGADLLLFPFARSFADGTCDQSRWDAEELPNYLNRIRTLGVPALMVNYLADSSLPDDHSFGGAFHVSAQGEVVAARPFGVEGMMIVEI